MLAGMPTISFCTAIHNRLYQFQELYAQNLEVVLNAGDVEWVVLNYNSSDGLDEFMESQGQLPAPIKYLKHQTRAGWHSSVAKNLAHAAGSGAILMNLDCDNLIDDAVRAIREEFAKETDILHLWTGIPQDGTYGRIAIRSKLFHELGGYDESFEPMGYQDKDLLVRAELHGGKLRSHKSRPDIAIKNTKEESIKYCASTCKTWEEMKLANRDRSLENLKKKRVVANRKEGGREYLNS